MSNTLVRTFGSPEEARAFAVEDGREYILTGCTVAFWTDEEEEEAAHVPPVWPERTPDEEARLEQFYAEERERIARLYPGKTVIYLEEGQTLEDHRDAAEYADALEAGEAVIDRLYAEQWEGWDDDLLRDLRPQDSAVALPGRFHIYTEATLGQYPPVEWHPGLEGYCPRAELIGFYGPGDSFKSFLALDWSCYVASQGFDVLYIAAEGLSGLQNRVAAWKQMHGVEELPHLYVQPLPVRMHERTDVDAFVACVQAQMPAPAFVVVDTLARNFVGGNENSAQDLGLFVEGAERIRSAFRATVIVVHHSTKDGTSERGGESLRNASFAMYRFDRKSKAEVVVSCDRMKDAETPASVTLRPVLVNLGPDKEGKLQTSLVACWPFGEDSTPSVFEESDAAIAKRVEMAQDITEVVRSWGTKPDTLSQTQVEKRVRGNATVIRNLLKDLALDSASPVQSEKDGKSIRYYFEMPHGD